MARRYFSNVTGTGTLTGAIGTSDTTVATSGFTSTPSVPFTAVLDRGLVAEECVLVTAVAGGSLTVQRGYDSTPASSHSAGATVEHAIIAEGPNTWDAHVEQTSGMHGVTGSIVGTTQAQTVTNKTHQASVYEGQNTTSPGSGPIHKATVDNTNRAGFTADTTGTASAGKGFNVIQSGADKFLVKADGSVVVTPSGTPTWAHDVTGNSRVTGAQTVTGTATVGGVSSSGAVSGTTGTFSGALSGTSLGLSGAITGATTIAASGNTTVGGTLGVTGATTLAALTATGNTTVGGTLGVTGATTAAAITASGLVTAGSISSGNMRAKDAYAGGVASVTSTSYAAMNADDVAFTMPYPPSGVVTVHVRAAIQNNTNTWTYVSFEIRDTNAAGAQRFAATDDSAAFLLGTGGDTRSATDVVTGLPTTGTMFIRLMGRTNSGNTGTVNYRHLAVVPSP